MEDRRMDGERLAKVETEVNNINSNLKQHALDNKEDFKELGNKIDDFIDVVNSKVDKSTFDKIVWFGIVTLVTVIGFFIKYTLFN